MALFAKKNQYDMQDPVKQFPQPPFPKQPQNAPGLACKMDPQPDHGEESYVGLGRLKGRKAIVTGADSGIGRAAAIAYAREGADVVLNYLPSEQADADEVIALIEKEGRKAIALPGDISDEAFCNRLIAEGAKELGGLDILAIIAGKQTAVDKIENLTTEQFDKTYKTNVYAMFWLSKAALMIMKPGSSIINTTSIVGDLPLENLLDYSSTKAAIINFTHSLAKQIGPKGIRVNAVAPGPVWTPLQTSGGQPQEAIPEFGKATALGRPGQPVELASVYVLLASQESSYITGEVIGITGGMRTAAG